ncbi:hypothetical protein ACFWXH_09850 [Mesorhizobium sp. NPDC059054]|uniref:hypothetical protein n=1 Tax=Mesorhizobium sp. NPDC059054 TaxID=3346711 RepID=UPI00369B0120
MKIKQGSALAALVIAGLAATAPASPAETTLDRMPAELETRLALSAAPPALRETATVYLLDPAKGYQLSRQGNSGITCIVERTSWDLSDFRNDIYIPLCYDAAGSRTYLRHIMEAATLRATGMDAATLNAEYQKRYRDKTFNVPEKPGVSYMVAPVMRTIGPPDMNVHTMAMPHVMFYAPGVTNDDIGAKPDLAARASLLSPFVDRQGAPEHSYIIQLVGDAEKTKILADEKPLLDDLCAYRDILCLRHGDH